MTIMSKGTYAHRVEAVMPHSYQVSQLMRLNRDLNALYELVYSQWRTVTSADYQVFGGQYRLLLETIKGLYNSCRKAPREAGLAEATAQLGRNYSALYELHSNILHFGINAPKNAQLQQALARLAEVDAKKAQQ